MTDLIDLRDRARARQLWQPGPTRVACKARTVFGTPKDPDHANCGGHRCGCVCHAPTEAERLLWKQIADEIEAYLTTDDDDQDTLL